MTGTVLDHVARGEPVFGAGVYSFRMAAEIITQGAHQDRSSSVSSSTLRRWIRAGLAPASFGRGVQETDVISFFDLVSLEIVRRLKDEGASLQRIKKLEQHMREVKPDLVRPFAHEAFWTDGSAIWAELGPGDQLIELVGRVNQYAWKPSVASFATEIRYKGGVAASWTVAEYVEIDPQVHFGAPVVRGTSVPVSTIRAELQSATPEEIAAWHGLHSSQVEGVRAYLEAA
jgi:uncharacterized protein (DUF433 family)